MKDVNTLSNSPKLTLHNSLIMRDQFFFTSIVTVALRKEGIIDVVG